MPDSSKSVQKFFIGNPNALIINEIGPVGSHLADSLLSIGCQVFYFGNKKKDRIDHLLETKNFEIIYNLDKGYELPFLTYIFYLSKTPQKFLTKISKLAKDKKAKVLFTSVGNQEKIKRILEEFETLGIDARGCLFGEIYGPRIDEGVFSAILKNSINGQKIRIPWDETSSFPLTFWLDFVNGLKKAIFSPDTKGKIFLLGKPVSFLGFLNEVEKKIRISSKVEFIPQNKIDFVEEFGKIDEFVDFPAETSLSSGIEETILWYKKESKNSQKDEKKKFYFKTQTSGRKKAIFGLSLFLFFLLIFFVFPVLVFLTNFSLAKNNFQKAKDNWEKRDLFQTRKAIKKTSVYFGRSKKIFEIFSPFYSLVGLETKISLIEPFLVNGEKFINSTDYFLDALENFSSVFLLSMRGQEIDISAKAREIDNLLDRAYFEVSLALGGFEGYWEDRSVPKLLGIDNYFFQGKTFLLNYKNEIIKLKLVVSNLPKFAGYEGKKVYLVILENNLELRPTGGFIGSYCLLTFDRGSLIDFDCREISSVDNLLAGKVEPPLPIKNFLGEERWYLKDANWDPDYPSSAKKIAWFFEKETGRKVDGVLAINLSGIKRILEVIGKIDLEGLSEDVNFQNVFERAVYFSGGFPVAEGKVDFLAEMVKQIMKKIKSDDVNSLKFIENLEKCLSKKEILVWFDSLPLANIVRTLNWDGLLKESFFCESLSQNCYEDYIFIVEANLGKNRANYFTKRTINYSFVLNENGNLSKNLKINWENLSLSQNWPAGNYKNFLRIFFPLGTQLQEVNFGDSSMTDFLTPIPPEEVEIATESGKTRVALFLEIPPTSRRTLELKYFTPDKIKFFDSTSYFLFISKQPGQEDIPYSLSFRFPQKTSILKIVPSGSFSSGNVLVNGLLDEDKVLRIDFQGQP